MASTNISLPVRPIPGSYGPPLFGSLKDRLDYFWFQGPESFFKSRAQKHKSTVFRTNIPPSFPFFLSINPQVIALTDCKSFATLFDMSIVEKKNILVGDFMPNVSYTGNMRVLAYLDPSEPKHAAIKSFAADILKSSSRVWASELTVNLERMWSAIEADVAESGSASFPLPMQKFLFRFLTKVIVGADPTEYPDVGETGFAILDKWLALQLLPTVSIRVLQPLEEIFLHSFPYPFLLVSGGYKKLYNFIESGGRDVVAKGEREYGLTTEEAIHNLLFILGFNAFGGMSIFFLSLLSTIGRDKTGLQEKLREEVRQSKGEISFESVQRMELVQSTVVEVLRLNPPVPLQFARAREDFVMSSHDAAFEVRKGELLCGYQPLAMLDGKVFDRAEEFVADRFTGAKGKQLLNYVFWSNGPQTGTPSTTNKQCPAKDYVVFTACMIVAWIFTRYDEFRCDDSSPAITKVVTARK
ncbi:hypothetical protein ACLOJK_011039 [Asimina triloba]